MISYALQVFIDFKKYKGVRDVQVKKVSKAIYNWAIDVLHNLTF